MDQTSSCQPPRAAPRNAAARQPKSSEQDGQQSSSCRVPSGLPSPSVCSEIEKSTSNSTSEDRVGFPNTDGSRSIRKSCEKSRSTKSSNKSPLPTATSLPQNAPRECESNRSNPLTNSEPVCVTRMKPNSESRSTLRRRSTSSQQFKSHQLLITKNIILDQSSDKIQLIEKLVSKSPAKLRYLVIIKKSQTHAILGVDIKLHAAAVAAANSSNLPSRKPDTQSNSSSSSSSCSSSVFSNTPSCTLGLVAPIWSHMEVSLNGDGGFSIQCNDNRQQQRHEFTPASVHGLWTVIQKVSRCIGEAQKKRYYLGSGFLNWTTDYAKSVDSDRASKAEWEYLSDLWSSRNDSQFALTANMEQPTDANDSADLRVRQTIRAQLKAVMHVLDLEEASSRDVQNALKERMGKALDLGKYSKFIDTEMLTVLGQMESSSQVLSYLYLGSEWNASNRDELLENNVGYILNITQEIDNFFPEDFVYKNIRLYDVAGSCLSAYFNETYDFIEEARKQGKSCLVHCKMGISRSAATVIAYLMKEHEFDIGEATQFVRDKRPIIAPNEGFQRQLFEYDGILRCSRHVRKFEQLSSFGKPRKSSARSGLRKKERLCTSLSDRLGASLVMEPITQGSWSDDDTSTTENTISRGHRLSFYQNGLAGSTPTRSVQTIINEYENRCVSALEMTYPDSNIHSDDDVIDSSDDSEYSTRERRAITPDSFRGSRVARSNSLPSNSQRSVIRKKYCSKYIAQLSSIKVSHTSSVHGQSSSKTAAMPKAAEAAPILEIYQPKEPPTIEMQVSNEEARPELSLMAKVLEQRALRHTSETEDCSSNISATTDSVGRVRQLGIVRSVTRQFEGHKPPIQKFEPVTNTASLVSYRTTPVRRNLPEVRRQPSPSRKNKLKTDDGLSLKFQKFARANGSEMQEVKQSENMVDRSLVARSKSSTELYLEQYKSCSHLQQRSVLSDTQYQYPILNL